MEHDPHFGFILAAYAITAVAILAMLAAVLIDYRTLRRRLARFGTREADRG